MKRGILIALLYLNFSGLAVSQDNAIHGPLGQGAVSQNGWSGSFHGSINGTASTLTISLNSTKLEGTIDASGYIYQLEGEVEGDRASGKIRDQNTGGEMEYSASLSGNIVSMQLHVTDPQGQMNQVQLEFSRTGADGPKENVERDQRIVGGWRHTTSYTSGDFGAVSEWYMQIRADGTYRYGDGQMMGGDADVSFDSGQGSASTGQWKTANSIVYINEGQGWQPYAAYIVDSNSMLFKFNDGSKQLWERYR